MTAPTIESLRAQGVHLHDPVRFRYLEVLALRAQSQPEAVRRLLADKLARAIAESAQQPPRQADATTSHAAPVSASALSALNQYLAERTQEPHHDETHAAHGDGDIEPAPELMKSTRRFSQAWSKIAAEQQVAQALMRGPENAGPLNSHKLMLRSLTLMQALSPDYLRRFLAQMDALLWLDQAQQQRLPRDGKAARKGRPRTPRD